MPAPSRPRVYEGICCIRGKRRARNCIDLDNIILLEEEDGEKKLGGDGRKDSRLWVDEM